MYDIAKECIILFLFLPFISYICQVKKAEEELAVKEAKLDELKAELLKPEYQSSYSKLTEIQNEIDAMEEAIMEDMENWEQLSSQLEELLQSEG